MPGTSFDDLPDDLDMSPLPGIESRNGKDYINPLKAAKDIYRPAWTQARSWLLL